MTASTGKGRGGPRAGSGRKPKNRGALPDIDIAHALAESAPEDIEAAARRHAVMAIASLLTILISGEIKIATVATANTIPDRGHFAHRVVDHARPAAAGRVSRPRRPVIPP